MKLINEAYKKVYQANNISLKYNFGMLLITIYDSLIRRDKLILASAVKKLINIGDISFHKDYKVALPYLNLEHELWLDPETGEKHYVTPLHGLFKFPSHLNWESFNYFRILLAPLPVGQLDLLSLNAHKTSLISLLPKINKRAIECCHPFLEVRCIQRCERLHLNMEDLSINYAANSEETVIVVQILVRKRR